MPYTDILFGTAVYSNENNKPLLPTTMPAQQNKTDFVLLVHAANLERLILN